MISKKEQLKSRANFVDNEGKLFLVRCLNCPNCSERGRENYGPCVSSGICAWCGWSEKDAVAK